MTAAALCVVIVLLLAAVIAYTIAITSRTEVELDPEMLGSGYQPSEWCPRCGGVWKVSDKRCQKCRLEREA